MTVSTVLSEALRNEIRTTLEADGKPFTIAVARRVYDLAIASRDLLVTASGSSVKSAIEAIEDSQGPLDSTTGPSSTPAPSIVAETFGARVIRELVAALPVLRGDKKHDDNPESLVHALAQARRDGMHDVATELEKKLFGRTLEGPRPIALTPVDDESDFEHGYVAGYAGALPNASNELYMLGYQKGTETRLLKRRFVPNAAHAITAYTRVNRELGDHGDPDVRRALFWRKYEEESLSYQSTFDPSKHRPGCLAINYGEDRECDRNCDVEKIPRISLGARGRLNDGPNCEAKGQCEDIKGDGTCYGCGRWLGDEEATKNEKPSGRVFERPRSGAENAFAPEGPDGVSS